MSDLARKALAEFYGTFALVFAGCGAIVIDDVAGGPVTHVGIALVFGLVVMAMIYAVGDVSGAHLNPAVSVGFAATKRLPAHHLPPYVVSQVAGACAAAWLLRVLFPEHATLGLTAPSGTVAQSFVLEVVLTAALMFVILCVSTGSKEKGTMAGIAVGGWVALAALFAGPISGASMNPARSLGPALASGRLDALWIYLVATPLGAFLGCGLWLPLEPQYGVAHRAEERRTRVPHELHRPS